MRPSSNGTTRSSRRVSNEGVCRHAGSQLADVDAGAGLIEAHGGLRRRRPALELVVPGQLLLACLGKEEHGEEVSERRIGVGPACPDSGDQSFMSLALAFVAAQPSARVAAVEDEPLDSLGVANGVGDGRGGALGDAQQHEPVEAGCVDDGLEVCHPAVQRELLRARDRKAHSPVRRIE